jgi:4-carboxymuconolactone decarboxylase
MPDHTPAETTRLLPIPPGDLNPEQRKLYEAITGGPRSQGPQLFRLTDDAGGLQGPFNALLLQPLLGGALQAVGAAVRYQTSLSDRARELAILMVAAHWDSEFERHAHEAVGAHVGLTQAELAALRRLDVSVFTDPEERAVADCTRHLLESGDLDDAGYRQTVATLGAEGVFELTTLVGYYATLALQLRVFRVAAPAG